MLHYQYITLNLYVYNDLNMYLRLISRNCAVIVCHWLFGRAGYSIAVR
jgi:hypothetical protein